MGAKRRDKSGISHNMSLWGALLGHKEYYVRTSGHALANALCKSDDILGEGADPHVFVGSAGEMVILQGDAGDFVDDGIIFTVAVLLRSKEKTGGIYKEGDSLGSRGGICIGSN